MSAKNGTCVGRNPHDGRRVVGTFGGKALCNDCRPLTDRQRRVRGLRVERKAKEAEKLEKAVEAAEAGEEKTS